jgi:hypothetical protein
MGNHGTTRSGSFALDFYDPAGTFQFEVAGNVGQIVYQSIDANDVLRVGKESRKARLSLRLVRSWR